MWINVRIEKLTEKKVFLFSDKAYYFILYITDTDRRNGPS